MITPWTGKVVIPKDGEYFFAYSAWLYARDGSDIYCYLMKNNGTTETYLASITNDVDGAANWDTQDDDATSSFSVLAALKEGDEVYVNVNAYGNTKLKNYAKRSLTFSGFLVK